MTRVLHVVGSLDRGGVETWLMHVLRSVDRSRAAMDFLVHSPRPGAYDAEARRLGAGIFACETPRRPGLYGRNFRRIVAGRGPYDVVHSHVHYYSGYVLAMAARAGVAARVAHSHNDTRCLDRTLNPLRRAYLAAMRRLIDRHATAGLAASRRAAASLFGERWASDPRWRVLLYGIDLGPFGEAVDRGAVRDSLGIPRDAFVVGHVGRFVMQKNHEFLVDVFGEVLRREPRAWLLLVGDGECRAAIEARLKAGGWASRATISASRPDVPRVMKGAMDAFVLPSRFEGLGLVLVEAQAAGLPCVASAEVPEEAILSPGSVTLLPLDRPAGEWAEAVLRVREDRVETGRLAEAAGFGRERSASALVEFYEAALGRGVASCAPSRA